MSEKSEAKSKGTSRREFIAATGAAIAGLAVGAAIGSQAFPKTVELPAVTRTETRTTTATVTAPAVTTTLTTTTAPRVPAVSPLTASKGGYMNKIIRVDLTTGKITTEPLPNESILRKYVGCFGLGLWYLMRELPIGAGPLDPENPLIFLNGPLVGTPVVAPNNCTITTLNGDTGFTAGRSHTHGWFGPFLAKAGYDGIIIKGASPKWVYLWIDDAKVELRDATKFLGKDTHESEDLIKQDLGVPIAMPPPAGGASVAAIGPMGENLIAGASIFNDKNHAFNHSGVGRIMGSKRLKAIAVRGTGTVPVFDSAKLAPFAKQWYDTTNTALSSAKNIYNAPVPTPPTTRPPDNPIYVPGTPFGGGMAATLQRQLAGEQLKGSDYENSYILKGQGISGKNWLVNHLGGEFGKGMSNQNVVRRPCYGCPKGCSRDNLPLEGKYKGSVFSLSGGGENQEGAASIVGVTAWDDVWYLTDLHDRLGCDSSTVGCSIAVAMEAYEKGLLTTKDTDGLELKWGDAAVVETLLKRIANREGKFARMLADGPKLAAERVGLPDAAVHIKGSGMNLHDWRRAWGILLGQIVSSGSGWPAGGADCWTTETDAGFPKGADPLDPYVKAEEVAKTGIVKFWNDCHGVCWFDTWGCPGVMTFTSGAIAAVVGWTDFDAKAAWDVGHRVLTLERVFNITRGWTIDDDIERVSRRLTDPAPDNMIDPRARGKSIAPYLAGWAHDYHEILGWDRETGRPLATTMRKLGLEEYIPLIWETTS